MTCEHGCVGRSSSDALKQEFANLLVELDANDRELRSKYDSGELEPADEHRIILPKEKIGHRLYELSNKIIQTSSCGEPDIGLIAAVVMHYAEPRCDIVHRGALALARGAIHSNAVADDSLS